MIQAEINEDYKKFMIPETLIPKYKDPEIFAQGLRKFSLLKEVNTFYSDTSMYCGDSRG